MTPQDLLHHIDSGEPWPAGAGAGFDLLLDWALDAQPEGAGTWQAATTSR